jgi:hypothetical protein
MLVSVLGRRVRSSFHPASRGTDTSHTRRDPHRPRSIRHAPFWPALLRLFLGTGRPARAIVALTFVRVAIASSTPVLLHELLRRLPAAAGAERFPSAWLGLAVLLGGAVIVTALLTQHWFHEALRIRTCIINGS